jgi:ubiquinone/menaquinone biosynthesis C-methylase UbiE
MEPLAESVTTSQQEPSPLTSLGDDAAKRLAAGLTSLRRNANLAQVHFTSHRKIWGWAIILLKMALRRLLTPIFERQAAYNQTNTQMILYLSEQVHLLRQDLDLLKRQHLEAMQKQHPDVAQQLHDLEQQRSKRFVEHSQQEIDLRELQKNWNEFGKIDPLWAIITWPDKKGNRWDLEEFFALGHAEIDAIMNHVSVLDIRQQRRRALDFGCGVGRITQALAAHFDEVVGVDIAPAMIELARTYNRYHGKCRYFVNDTNELKLFEDNTFDFIYSIITLQHIKPPYIKGYLKEFLRILAPGGLLVFQVPSEPIAEFRLTRATPEESYAFTYDADPHHRPYMEMHGMLKDEVIAWLQKHGGAVVQVMDDNSAGPNWVSFRYFVTKP